MTANIFVRSAHVVDIILALYRRRQDDLRFFLKRARWGFLPSSRTNRNAISTKILRIAADSARV